MRTAQRSKRLDEGSPGFGDTVAPPAGDGRPFNTVRRSVINDGVEALGR